MFNNVKNARLVHTIPEGSVCVRDPLGRGFIIAGPEHEPYLFGADESITVIKPVDLSQPRRDDAATPPDPAP